MTAWEEAKIYAWALKPILAEARNMRIAELEINKQENDG